VDITFDSRWILATTDDYLLVIRADYEDEGGRYIVNNLTKIFS
jgi:hypothetical protein